MRFAGAVLLLAPSFSLALGQRSTKDRPDDAPGYQIHAMYVLPSDGVDESLDINGRIATSVAAFNDWLKAQTGGQKLRLDTYRGKVDVTFHRLESSDAEIRGKGDFSRDAIEAELAVAGFNDKRKIYAVYYGGSVVTNCGTGPFPPELVGHVAAVYLKGGIPGESWHCEDNPVGEGSKPGDHEFGMIHEIVHTLGFVQSCGRHAHDSHTNADPADLMYAGPKPWVPATLDAAHDSYFKHGIAGCLDLADSVFLTPSTKNAAPPPGW